MSSSSDIIYFNGVNATSGQYAHPPLSIADIAARLRSNPSPDVVEPDAERRKELEQRAEDVASGSFDVKFGVSKGDLSQTGWGVLFPAGQAYAQVREALAPLLRHRQAQAGALYRECYDTRGVQPGEGARPFLKRMGAASSGAVDPDRFPYYLLIVGSPDEISFMFQYQLDVQYAVGRIHFDTIEEYAQYASSVVRSEGGESPLAKKMVLFGVQHERDPATQASTAGLIFPLARDIPLPEADTGTPWAFETISGAAASKERLGRLLGGPDTPALIFTASHGAEFERLDRRQVRHQGALICGNWPGPGQSGFSAVQPDYYFSGDDIGADANLLGLISFHFACFSAGMPRFDDFPHLRGSRAAIAERAFIGGLPRRMLGHPRGGALAVIGHVERAWSFSFSDAYGGGGMSTFSSALQTLLYAGMPVGAALEYFNNRYAELATGLTADMEALRNNEHVDDYELVTKWTEHNDARSYVVLGDPAARLVPFAGSISMPAPVETSHWGVSTARTETPAAPVETPAASVDMPAAPTPAPAAPAATPAPGATNAPLPPPSPAPAPSGAAAPVPAGTLPPDTLVVAVQMQTGPGGVSFGGFLGIGGGGESGGAVKETIDKLSATLKDFTEQLGKTLQAVIEDAANLDVETYVADDLASIRNANYDFTNAQLRAATRMGLDGDTRVLVPRNDGQLDERLWAIHVAMVQQAQANRAEMIRAISAAAAGLVNAIQGK